MPFTASHPAAVLPLAFLPKRLVCMTGLIVGSVAPDFEYFLRMEQKQVIGHTVGGLFYFCLPLGLLLCFIFHNIVRDSFIDSLPRFLKARMNGIVGFDWNGYFLKRWYVVAASILVGAATHIIWDSFTHGQYKIFQHPSTIAGAAIICAAVWMLPKDKTVTTGISIKYWCTFAAMFALVVLLFENVLHIDFNFAALTKFFAGFGGDDAAYARVVRLVVRVISAGLIAVVATSAIFTAKKSSNNHTKIFERPQRLYESAMSGGISADEMREVANWPLDDISLLFAAADQTRKKHFGNTVDPCTLMNVKSGNCSEDCAFCTQSAHNNADVKVQNLSGPNDIISQCKNAWSKNLPFCVVSSGRRLDESEFKTLCDTLIACRNDCGNVNDNNNNNISDNINDNNNDNISNNISNNNVGEIHASLGILDDNEFKMLRDAGVVCYNHNLETSRSFFKNIVTTHTYDDRIMTVKRAKSAGLKVCCGGIFGMGESWEQRIELCLALRELGVDTVPINFLNAVSGVRLKPLNEPPLELLKTVSLFRLAMPKATIKVCGGREKNLGELQPLIFQAGANGYITGGYLTTSGAGIDEDDAMIKLLGLSRGGGGGITSPRP